MTKFEEEVKRPKKAYIDPFCKRDVDFTGVAKKFTEGAQTLKEWKEYAFLLEDKLKPQQQALPVVPECVAEWYEKKKNKLEIAVYSINTLIDKKSFNDLTKIEKWFEGVENKPIETIFKMKDGYQVEKPQLFYLKNKITGNVLVYDESPELSEVSELFATGGEFELENYTFTQQEIDSMETGSYEQIEVEK